MNKLTYATIAATGRSQIWRPSDRENIMKATIKYVAPWLAAAAIGGAIALAPIASADTNPLVPFGTNPHVPSERYHVSNHDETNTTNGFIDVPF
jgi:hypothetical protein